MKQQIRSRGKPLFEWLLHPFDAEAFLDKYWQKQVLLVKRKNPHYHEAVLTAKNIDDLLSTVDLPSTIVNLGQNAIGISKTDYSNGSYVSSADVLRLHRQGNTIILRALQHWVPQLRDLCQAVEEVFLCEAQTNVYLTPANTQSSFPHWDAHDIFVIQVAGSKKWILHECEMKLPLPSYEFDRNIHAIGREAGEIVLDAGDIAYIPRGLAHNPVANDYSIHISLGVKVNTWATLISKLVEQCIADTVHCREALPIDCASGSFDLRRCLEELPQRLATLSDARRLQPILASLEDAFISRRITRTAGVLSQISISQAVGLDTTVKVPDGTYAKLVINKDGCEAVLNGVQLRLEAKFADAIKLLSEGKICRVADLPLVSEAHRVAFAEKLVSEGCITVAAV